MLPNVVSWDGHSLNSGNYLGYVLDGLPLVTPASGVYVEHADITPTLVGLKLTGPFVTIQIIYQDALSNKHLRDTEMKRWFQTNQVRKTTARKLIVNDGTRDWSVMARPFSVTPDGNSVVVVLGTEEAFWKMETERTDSWTITATGQQKTITVVGDYCKPIFEVTPGGAKTSGFLYYRFVEVQPPSSTVNLGRYALDIAGSTSITSLIADSTKSNQINQVGGITAAATTINIDTAVGGGLPTVGSGYVDTEQISWTNNTGSQLQGVSRGVNGTTAATHADNAVIKNSKIQANGNDFRVMEGNTETSRWLGSFNSATPKIWTALEWKPKLTMTLGVATLSTGSLTEIYVKNTPANKTALSKMPTSGIFKIGSERFTYNGIDLAKMRFTNVVPGAKLTTRAAHSINDTITWIQHDLWFVYGNLGADAPVQDDTYKPMFDLDNSSNTSWVFTEFDDETMTRTAEWEKTISSSLPSKTAFFYSDSEETFINPSTDLGISIPVGTVNNAPRAENATAYATVYCAAGFSGMTDANGKRYRFDTYWPATTIDIRRSQNGKTFTSAYTIEKPTAVQTWEAWSLPGPISFSGTLYFYIQLYVKVSVPGKVGNKLAVEINSITLTVDSTNVPTISVDTENQTYWLDATFTNISTTEQEAFTIQGPMKTGEKVTVDCQKRVAYHQDGTYWAVGLNSDRAEWLVAENGNNTIQYDETGVTNCAVNIRQTDRIAL